MARKKPVKPVEPVMTIDEAFDAALDESPSEDKDGIKEHQQNAYEKWEAHWRTACDWHASPEAWQAWNGAIDLIAAYLANGFSENEFYHAIPKMDKVVEKLQRFKVK